MICRTAESRLLLLSITLIEKNVKFFLKIGDRFTFLTMDKGRGDLAPTDCARKCLLNRRQVSGRGDLAPTDCARKCLLNRRQVSGRGDLAPTDCARKCLLNRRQVSGRGDLAPTDCAFIGGRKYGRSRMRLPKPYFAFRHEHETACILILPP